MDILEKILGDTALDKMAADNIRTAAENEMKKNKYHRDYDRIAALSAEYNELIGTDGILAESEASGIEKLLEKTARQNSTNKIRLRKCRHIAAAVCAAALLAANFVTVSAFDLDIFSFIVNYAKGGITVDFADNYALVGIELETSENDPYGIAGECEKYGISAEVPHYLPEGFEITNIEHNENSIMTSVTFDIRKRSEPEKVISFAYDKYFKDSYNLGIPGDGRNISETEINGHTAVISEKDNVFTLSFRSGDTIVLISSKALERDECEKIAGSVY